MADLLEKVHERLDFHLGDSNMRRDRFLKGDMANGGGFVSIDVLLTFNRLKVLTTDTEVVAKAAEQSNVVELSEDRTSLKRKAPEPRSDSVPLTVFAETFPADTRWEQVRDASSTCGKVDYVRLRSPACEPHPCG